MLGTPGRTGGPRRPTSDDDDDDDDDDFDDDFDDDDAQSVGKQNIIIGLHFRVKETPNLSLKNKTLFEN
tara:strand:- start:1568 stop:1774 length:207 start_codon:yes stop_codon:yes gene_type:complete